MSSKELLPFRMSALLLWSARSAFWAATQSWEAASLLAASARKHGHSYAASCSAALTRRSVTLSLPRLA